MHNNRMDIDVYLSMIYRMVDKCNQGRRARYKSILIRREFIFFRIGVAVKYRGFVYKLNAAN